MADVQVQIETTPNPRSLKFIVNRQLLAVGGRDFPTVDLALRAPLARRLFDIDGVDGVYIGVNFVTVTKMPDAAWESLAPRLTEAIRVHLTAGESVLGDSESQGHAGADDPVSARIRQVLDEYVRPAVAQDGGDVIFAGYADGVVRLHLRGSCSGCPSSLMTLKMGIQNILREQVPEVREVVQV